MKESEYIGAGGLVSDCEPHEWFSSFSRHSLNTKVIRLHVCLSGCVSASLCLPVCHSNHIILNSRYTIYKTKTDAELVRHWSFSFLSLCLTLSLSLSVFLYLSPCYKTPPNPAASPTPPHPTAEPPPSPPPPASSTSSTAAAADVRFVKGKGAAQNVTCAMDLLSWEKRWVVYRSIETTTVDCLNHSLIVPLFL